MCTLYVCVLLKVGREGREISFLLSSSFFSSFLPLSFFLLPSFLPLLPLLVFYLSSPLPPPLLDLCIPKNSAQFVISISEQLARSDPHLTVEFLSEVVAGFQQYTFALKQLCLAYMSPWLPILSRFVARSEGATTSTEQEKVMKLIDLLVALTISEEEVSVSHFSSSEE